VASLSATLPQPRGRIAQAAATAVGGAATFVITACVARVAIAATADPTFLVPSGRRTGFPRWMRGPLDGLGGPATLHTFLVLIAVMVVAWLVLLACARWVPVWLIATGVVAATLICAVAPPLLSTDVFNYIAYGVMGTHGVDPYLHGPVVLLGQPVYGYTGHLWKDVPSAYGPLFTLLSYALAPLGVAGAFWALKALSAAAALGTAAFVWAAARRLERSPAAALVLVALNPLVLVYAVGGAHNDLLMELPLAAAVYFVVAKRPAAAGAAAVTAIAIKASAGLALPFILLGARPRRRALAGAAAAAAVIGVPSLVVFGTSLTKMVDALSAQGQFHWIVVSVPTTPASRLSITRPAVR
jgi:alpha-1,6-mannosyltransferase